MMDYYSHIATVAYASGWPVRLFVVEHVSGTEADYYNIQYGVGFPEQISQYEGSWLPYHLEEKRQIF